MKQFNISRCGELLSKEEFFCELTDEMNKHLQGKWKDTVDLGDCRGTYIYDFGERDDGVIGHVYAIRVPGATRGYLYTDENNFVSEIGLYEEQCYGKAIGCFNRTLESVKEHFIGWKLVM